MWIGLSQAPSDEGSRTRCVPTIWSPNAANQSHLVCLAQPLMKRGVKALAWFIGMHRQQWASAREGDPAANARKHVGVRSKRSLSVQRQLHRPATCGNVGTQMSLAGRQPADTPNHAIRTKRTGSRPAILLAERKGAPFAALRLLWRIYRTQERRAVTADFRSGGDSHG